MTANSFSAKNAPQFTDSGAPDIAVDDTLVAAYAEKVGNRRAGTTTERNAAAGADLWAGLRWGDLTDLLEYQYSGTGWVIAGGVEVMENVAAGAFGTGWSATAGAGHVPRLYKIGRVVTMTGAVTLAAGGSPSNMLTVPVAFRPPNANTRFIGCGTTSKGVAYELALTAGVVSFPSGYNTAPIAADSVLPLTSSWIMD